MAEVIAGQSVALLSQWYDFQGGSLTNLDATPTITITSVATGASALSATSSGVTHPGTGSYGYVWTPGSSLTPGLYLATWAGLKSGAPVTATETITVTAPGTPTGPSPDADGICYATREEVQRALDIKGIAANNTQVDRACRAASRDIDGQMQRVFYPTDTTHYFDWPSFQYAYPWRLWLDQWELATIPTAVTSGGATIPLTACNFEPVNSGPPYTYLELRRDQPYSFGVGPTPQRDIAITGTWGYTADTKPAGQLAAAVSSTTATSVTVTDGSLVGVGDLLIVDSERMLITGRSSTDTGQTVLAGGVTVSPADNAVTVTDGTQVHVGEALQVDVERMLVLDVTGNIATVKRAWDGTVLAAHTVGARIYAFRTLSVQRGQLGTTAAVHGNGSAASIHRVPALIKDLAVAEAEDQVLQEIAGYARTVPSQSGNSKSVTASTTALDNLRERAYGAYGRKARSRVI